MVFDCVQFPLFGCPQECNCKIYMHKLEGEIRDHSDIKEKHGKSSKQPADVRHHFFGVFNTESPFPYPVNNFHNLS